MKRRRLIKGLVGLGLGAGLAYWWAGRYWDGYVANPCQQGLDEKLKSSELWQTIWADLEPSLVWDAHVHTVGLGDSDSGVWVNPDMQSWLHPLQHLQYQFYMNAACIKDPKQVDQGYLQRVLSLLQEMPKGVKAMLLAFDYHHDTNGSPVLPLSTFYVPNDYVAKLARQYPQYFEWVASIHPYRVDAIDALRKAKAQGAVAVKWLPPAHNMDPLSERCEEFYQTMAELELPLICHAGVEKAVQGSDTQELGNPLRLRRALDAGVKVVVAHCATLGENLDLDLASPKPISSFELFKRIMQEYPNNCYGELSAILQVNRKPEQIEYLLQRQDWHDRLVNGSDYPLPAVMPLISLKNLQRAGLLEQKWLEPLNEIRQANGLLFDFAVKRLLKFDSNRFSPQIFETRRLFG